jgi:hypothetical protein
MLNIPLLIRLSSTSEIYDRRLQTSRENNPRRLKSQLISWKIIDASRVELTGRFAGNRLQNAHALSGRSVTLHRSLRPYTVAIFPLAFLKKNL